MDDQDAMNNSISLLDEVYGYSAKNGDCNSESQERISEVNFNVNSTVKDSVKSENANMLNIEQAGEKSIIIDEQNASKSSANMHEEIFTSELLSEKNSSLINGIISTNCPLTEIANFAESAIPQCSKEGNKEGNRDKMKYKREQILYDEIINIEELTDEGSIVTNDSNLLEDRDTSFTGNEDRENLGLDVACLRKNEEISSTENSRESSEDVVEKYFSIIQKIESCSEGLQSDVIEPLTEESEKLNSLEKPTREKTEDSDLKSEEWIGNSKRKKEMNLKDDSGSSNQDEDGSKKTDPEDDSNINGYGVNILQMPEMVLEDIFKNLSLDDICSSVRPTCRTFYHASARVLRLVFRNIMPKLDTSIKCLEDMPFGNQWSRICTGYLTYKLLQSELLTLRAACARQVESGLWCFIPGKTLEEYMRLINGILDERTTGILDGISDILVNINKHAIEYFDSLYQAPFTLRDMKLFGVEIIEILSTAMNVSANMTVTYSAGGNSCFIAGKFGITHCTELKSPPLKRNTLEAHRKATLMYLRYLVRANNCDIVLRKLREWNKVVKNGSNLPCPYLGCPQWELKDRFNVVGDYIHEIYKKDAVDEASNTDWAAQYADCNVNMECTFELICPKFMHPLGVEFQASHEIIVKEDGVNGESQKETEEKFFNGNGTYSTANEVLRYLFQRWEKNHIFCMLNGEEYSFNMSLILKHPESAVQAGMPKEERINITEACITNSEGKQECGLEIKGDCKFV